MLDLLFAPLLESHVLLEEVEQTLAQANALVTVKDLPNVQLLVASVIFLLLQLRIDLLGGRLLISSHA